jgi:hypothetical protein
MIIGTVRVEEARIYDSFAGYHPFHAEETQEPCGSLEVFWIESGLTGKPAHDEWEGTTYLAGGWYWQAGFPGCMPDSDAPSGPFASSRQALKDADEWNPEFDDES